MSNYVKLTDFQTKDGLLSGDPLKKIKGTEIDDEFDSLATHIATKLDSVNAALTGVPTAPTAAVSTSTTQLATTAFVQTATTAAVALAFPIGSIYINAAVSTNPATLLGFGTWTAFGTGRVLIGIDTSSSAFDTLGETGGSSDAVVVSHTHTASSSVSDPGHYHVISNQANSYGGSGATTVGNYQPEGSNPYTDTNTTGISVSTSVNTTGASGTNANLPPYITVYMWKRIA